MATRNTRRWAAVFECEDGWYPLLDVLCSLLQQDFAAAAQRYADQRSVEGTAPYEGAAVVTAVDVERARIAMSAAADAVPVAGQVKQKFGSLRFYVHSATPAQHAYIAFAEAMSARTCEVCGLPGELSKGRWIRTRCQRHQDERNH